MRRVEPGCRGGGVRQRREHDARKRARGWLSQHSVRAACAQRSAGPQEPVAVARHGCLARTAAAAAAGCSAPPLGQPPHEVCQCALVGRTRRRRLQCALQRVGYEVTQAGRERPQRASPRRPLVAPAAAAAQLPPQLTHVHLRQQRCHGADRPGATGPPCRRPGGSLRPLGVVRVAVKVLVVARPLVVTQRLLYQDSGGKRRRRHRATASS